MHPLDNEFFEEYKRLDKLCADLLSTNTGVREYIAQMEAQDAAGSRCVPFWGAEMNRLMRVHRIRNRLAHDYSVNAISDADDLSFLRRFHDDILCTQDPLALLRKAEQAANMRSAQKKTVLLQCRLKQVQFLLLWVSFILTRKRTWGN